MEFEMYDSEPGKQLALEIYRDAVKPTAKEIAPELARTVKNLLIPLKIVNTVAEAAQDAWQNLVDRVALFHAKTPPEQLVEPPLHIAGPAFLNFCFAAKVEVLRDLYARLLASCMDREKLDYSHPSFVHVLQQLSPLEAQILQYIKEHRDSRWWNINDNPTVKKSAKKVWQDFCFEEVKVETEDEDLIFMALDNLIRLRILRHGEYSNTEIAQSSYDMYELSVENSELIELTEYGDKFLWICCPETEATD